MFKKLYMYTYLNTIIQPHFLYVLYVYNYMLKICFSTFQRGENQVFVYFMFLTHHRRGRLYFSVLYAFLIIVNQFVSYYYSHKL